MAVILEQKLKDFVDGHTLYPKYLYIGTMEKLALQHKTGKPQLSGQKYCGLEIVLVQRQNFLEVG